MTHELASVAGKVSMAYVGEKPWHGLGQELTADADLDTWAEESGMLFQVKRSRVRYGSGNLLWDQKHVLYRSDTKAPLGIVSPEYEVVQPREIIEFFRDLTETAGFKMETAGVLFGGQRYWALARMGKSAMVADNDKIGQFLLLATSCDGSASTTAQFETIRVVCNNTLSMALSSSDASTIRIRHRSKFDADSVKKKLGVGQAAFAKFCDAANALSKVQVTASAADVFLRQLLNIETPIAEPIAHKGYTKVMDLFAGGSGIAITPTAWGLVNAVTEYVDHHRTTKTPDAALDHQWWGDGARLKTGALELALDTLV